MVTKAEYLLMANGAYRDLEVDQGKDEAKLPKSLAAYGWTDITFKTVNNLDLHGPGLAATAEIKTGKRRLIEFLISPLLRYRDESFRER